MTAAMPGEDVGYTITVRNPGTVPITDAMVAVTLPLGKMTVQAAPGGTIGDGRITWTTQSVLPGAQAIFTFHGTLLPALQQGDTVRAVATLTAQSMGAPASAQAELKVGPRAEALPIIAAIGSSSPASATAATPPATGNPALTFFLGGQQASSSSAVTLTVPATPSPTRSAGTSLVVSQQADRSQLQPGDVVRYAVWVRNASAQPITNITLTMHYAQRQLLITDAGGGLQSGETVTWTIPVLQAGTEQKFEYVARAQQTLRKGDVVSTVVEVTAAGLKTQLSLDDIRVRQRMPDAGVEQKYFTPPAQAPVLRPIGQ